MDNCTAEFERLASQVGSLDCNGNAFVTFTSPFSLDNWTMPVIEWMLISGAVAGLLHAIKRRRQTGDSSNLVVWWAGFLMLFLIEPFTYFPQWFGLEDLIGLTFVHNQFSIQFFYNRLPLYIMAMYPVFTYVGYTLVQHSGIFERKNPVVGAICVGMAFHVLYETVDMVGPQFRWWVWNTELRLLDPWIGIVPTLCMVAFAFAVPAGITLLARTLSRPGQGMLRMIGNVAATGLGTYLVVAMVVTAPYTILHFAGFDIQQARWISYWLVILPAGGFAFWALLDAYRSRQRGDLALSAGVANDNYGLVCAVTFLLVTTVLWIAAMPEYLAARDGLTSTGAPIGSFTYSAVTGVLSVALVYLCCSGGTATPTR